LGVVGLALGTWLLWPRPRDPEENDIPDVIRGTGPAQVVPKPPARDLTPPVRALIADLEHRDVNRRELAARSLKELGAREAVPALVRRVADDRWEGGERDASKEAALDALNALAPGQVAGALKEATRSKNAKVRAWATARLAAQLVPGIGQRGANPHRPSRVWEGSNSKPDGEP
jgi:hypothetical protein